MYFPTCAVIARTLKTIKTAAPHMELAATKRTLTGLTCTIANFAAVSEVFDLKTLFYVTFFNARISDNGRASSMLYSLFSSPILTMSCGCTAAGMSLGFVGF
jgi:hypothetical protein